MTDLKVLRGGSMKAGDTEPTLRLKAIEGGNPFNLTGYSVDIAVAFANDSSIIVDSSATIEEETRGIVTYSWSDGETDDPGVYEVELVASNGTDEITFPNRGTATVHIEDRLV
jgi:hypothetical protein